MSARRYRLTRPRIPVGPRHYVVVPASAGTDDDAVEPDMLTWAYRAGRDLAVAELGNPGCFTLLFSGARARHRAAPHVHVFLVPTVRAKRWMFLLMALKPLRRWMHLIRDWRGSFPGR